MHKTPAGRQWRNQPTSAMWDARCLLPAGPPRCFCSASAIAAAPVASHPTYIYGPSQAFLSDHCLSRQRRGPSPPPKPERQLKDTTVTMGAAAAAAPRLSANQKRALAVRVPIAAGGRPAGGGRRRGGRGGAAARGSGRARAQESGTHARDALRCAERSNAARTNVARSNAAAADGDRPAPLAPRCCSSRAALRAHARCAASCAPRAPSSGS